MLYPPWGKIKRGAANQERFTAAETLPGPNAYGRLTPRYLTATATSTPGAGAASIVLCFGWGCQPSIHSSTIKPITQATATCQPCFSHNPTDS